MMEMTQLAEALIGYLTQGFGCLWRRENALLLVWYDIPLSIPSPLSICLLYLF